MRVPLGLLLGVAVAASVTLLVGSHTFELPPKGSVQLGYRGTGQFTIYNLHTQAALASANEIPPSVPPASDEGPKAGTVYTNLKVLGDVNAGEFTRLMVSLARWVAPTQGCAACHNLNNFADDSLYTKVVARRMLQMTRYINANWTKHVGQTGVTCYTCHRGQLVPPNVWFTNPGPQRAAGVLQMPAGKNHPSALAGGSALPLDPFTPFLEEKNEIRVSSTTALQTGDRQSIKQAEWTYALMMAFSKSLGVNCNYCHNTRSFYSWAVSPPQRVTAWYGIRMVRDLNNSYLVPLHDVFPASHLGPALGDSPKVYCATCHNGVYKPLFGVSMAKDFPELTAKPEAKSAAATPAAAESSASLR